MFISTEYVDFYDLFQDYERRNFIKVNILTKTGVKLIL